MRKPPYSTVQKPYGRALLQLARQRDDIVCLSGDLTRQCEVDLFRDELPDRFVHAGMAEANMIGMAGAMAREGLNPFVHTFGVFATRRPLDQIVNAMAYPNLPVRLIGFMPGISSPGGPSHQAIDDVALMRALPNMTVLDVADATEIEQMVPLIAEHAGPVYLRLKRGDIPIIFDDGERDLSLRQAQVIQSGGEVALLTNGMLLSASLTAAAALEEAGVPVSVVNVPVIKPVDTDTVLGAARQARAVVTAENHSIIGGLGSAVAETLAEAGLGRTLRRVGLRDTFAEGSLTAPYLFERYGLSTQDIIEAAWQALGRSDDAPRAPATTVEVGEYAPV